MDEWLDYKDVTRLTRLSRSTIWRKEGFGDFPRRRKMPGSRILKWLRSDVEKWMKDQNKAK